MARVHKLPVGGNAEDRKIVLPDQVQLSLQEIAASAQHGLLAFSVAVGMQVLDVLIGEDVHRAAGDKGKWNPEREAPFVMELAQPRSRWADGRWRYGGPGSAR